MSADEPAAIKSLSDLPAGTATNTLSYWPWLGINWGVTMVPPMFRWMATNV